MLRAILLATALAALSIPAALSFASADETEPEAISHAPSIPWTQHWFDDEALPATTGWFLVPFTVDQPAYVRFDTDIFAGSGAEGAMWAALLVVEQGSMGGFPPLLGFSTTSATSVATVSHEGTDVTCCEGMWTSYSYTWGDGPEVAIPLQPGEVAWFGLAADNWGDWDDAYFQVSGQAFITMGEPRVGERVEAVDLYADALAQGTNVKLLGADVVALPGDSERTWTTEGFGIFALDAYAWGTSATLTLDIPGETSRVVALEQDAGVYAGAHRAGTYRVALTDIETPLTTVAGFAGSGGLSARALFVDIDIPGDSAFIYSWPEE